MKSRRLTGYPSRRGLYPTIGDRIVHRGKFGLTMSALGQKRTLRIVCSMSALPPIADIDRRGRDVRFVPKADILRCEKNVVIRSPCRRVRAALGAQLDQAPWRP